MKVAIIGCGMIGCGQHAPAYLKNEKAEIKYFCDTIPERAENAVKNFGCGIAVTDYKEVLKDSEVEAISVCTPNNMHAAISIDALKAGKHVLCEKPASVGLASALEMQKAQHETGKTLNIGVCNRFNGKVKKVRELIEQGELGEIYQVYASFRRCRGIPGLGGAFTDLSVSGGGVNIDWGVHFFDIIMYCCSDPEVKTVSAEKFCQLGNPIEKYVYEEMWAGPPKKDGVCDVEEGVTGIIRTKGPVITFNGAWAQNIDEEEMFIDIMGTKGGIRLQYGGDFTLYSTKNGMLMKSTFKLNSEKDGASMFENEINEFVDCIESGERLPSHIDTNIITAAMMDAIYKSAELHQEIKIGE